MKAFVKEGCMECANSICDECERQDVFTLDEVQRAKRIILASMDGRQRHSRILDEIVTEEALDRINRETGQQNDRSYMAYRLEAVAW